MKANPAVGSRVSGCSRMPWHVVSLLSVGMIIAYFDRVNLSVAMPEMAKEFGWSETQQGLAMSAIFWTYTVFQIPSGILVDRYGVRLPYILGLLLWSVASAWTGLTGALATLVALRLLVGLGESVVTPASMRYIRIHFDEERRGLAVGLYMTGTKIGPALGLPVCAWLVAEHGWRVMFLVIGLAGLLWLVPWMKWVQADDPAALARSEALRRQRAGAMAQVSTGAILCSPLMWGIILGTYCYMYFVYYSMTWMPAYFKRVHGMSVTETGWYGGAAFGGMAAVAALAGWAADLLIRRGYDPVSVRKAFTIAGFVAAATQTMAVLVESHGWMLFFTVFALCGLGLATANYWALTQSLIPGGSIAMVVGIQNTAANVAGIVAPWLTGWMIERTGSFETPIKAVGFWLLLGTVSYLILVRRRFAPQAV